jgi:hypothetical protein
VTLVPFAPPSPPGFLSPAAFPFPNGPFALPNDAPPAAPQPYFVGKTLTAQGNPTTVVAVQNPTGRGDAIIVSANSSNGGPAPVSCTDTQGNAYSLAAYEPLDQSTCVYISQNSNPMTAADTITVTWKAGNGTTAIVTGCSLPALGSGSGYLTYPMTAIAAAGGGFPSAIRVTAPYGLSQAPSLVIATLASEATAQCVIPQGWNVLATSPPTGNVFGNAVTLVMYQFTTSAITAGSTLASAQLSAAASGALIAVVLAPETRFAPNLPIPTPPGMLSPSAFPFTPVSPAVINDVPPVTPRPYLICQGANNATGSTVTVPVQGSTQMQPGDTIVVLALVQVQAMSVTDTKGNTYTAAGQLNTGDGGLFVAQNATPLTAGDSITATFTGSTIEVKDLVAAGIPVSMYATAFPAAPAGPYLTVDTTPATIAASQTVTNTGYAQLTPGYGVATTGRPELVIAAFGNSAAAGPPVFGQDWIPFASFGDTSTGIISFRIVLAYKLITSKVPGTVTAWSRSAAVANSSIFLAGLYPETRFAPNRPAPDMPPGMQSPGAWQFTPMPRNGAVTGTRFLTGQTVTTASVADQVGRQLSGSAAAAGTVTSQPGKSFAASATATGTIARAAARALTGTVAAAGSLIRQAARTLTGSTATAGSLTRQQGKALTASASTTATVTRQPGRALTATAATAGTLTRTAARALTAAVLTAATMTRHPGKALAATVTAAVTLTRQARKALAAAAVTSGTLARQAARTLSGTVTPTGVLTLAKVFGRMFTATVTTTGTLARKAARRLSGSVTASGSFTGLVVKAVQKPVQFVLGAAQLTWRILRGRST